MDDTKMEKFEHKHFGKKRFEKIGLLHKLDMHCASTATVSVPGAQGQSKDNRRYRNELPDPSAQLKLMALPNDKDRYTKYTSTSLEKAYKPELYVETDLGIPVDLLDLSVYNPPNEVLPLAPEDEELLRDDEEVTPVEKDDIRRKEQSTDKGISLLNEIHYISPLSDEAAKQSLTEKQAKEKRERRGDGNILKYLSTRKRRIQQIEASSESSTSRLVHKTNKNLIPVDVTPLFPDFDRRRKIQQIEESFKAAKSRPVHKTNKNLVPVDVMPLFPDFNRSNDQFILTTFDGAPTADSKVYGKLNNSVRDFVESEAIMKCFLAKGSDPGVQEKCTTYMVPLLDEISKIILEGSEKISYSRIRDYHWDLRREDRDNPRYIVAFKEQEAHYVPVAANLTLRTRRAKKGISSDVAANLTLRRRRAKKGISSDVAKDFITPPADAASLRRSSELEREGLEIQDGHEMLHQDARHSEGEQSSGVESRHVVTDG